jgi:diguanylate cyclase (GGDEF)-like protein
MIYGGITVLKWGAIILIILLVLIVFYETFLILKMRNKIVTLRTIKEKMYVLSDKINALDMNDKENVYNLLLETAIELIPNASKGSILTLEEDGLFHYKALIGYSEKIKNLTLRKEEIFLYKINNFTKTVLITDPRKLDEKIVDKSKIDTLKKYEALEINCIISSPIYIDKKFVGIINVDGINKSRGFDKDDIYIMNYIKNELQLALKTSSIQSSLRYFANFDELTGVFNRRYMKQLFAKEIENIKITGQKCVIVSMDIDNFKCINDTYGHSAGDAALRIFSTILKQNIRKTDIYGRLSGDEFALLLRNISKEKAEEKMEDIRRQLLGNNIGSIRLSFSYGVYYLDKDNMLSVEEILDATDKKMYKYKNKRKKEKIKQYKDVIEL